MTSLRRAAAAALLALCLAATTACFGAADDASDGSDGSSATSEATSGATAGADQTLSDFCTAAGLVAFMTTGADLQLWASSMRDLEWPADLEGDALAGLELLLTYAEQVPETASAEDIPEPEHSAEEQAQLEAYSAYLERCPQVTDPPTPVGSATE